MTNHEELAAGLLLLLIILPMVMWGAGSPLLRDSLPSRDCVATGA